MGADYSFYVKTIETHACAFLALNSLAIGMLYSKCRNMSNSGQNWKQKGIFYTVFYEEPVSSGPTCQLSRLELIYFDDAFYYAKKWAFEKYVHCTVKIIANHGVKISSEGGFKKSHYPLEDIVYFLASSTVKWLIIK